MSVSLAWVSVLLILLLLVIAVPLGIIAGVYAISRRPRDELTNPNLAPCPDCQKLISIHASSCPHCGRPMKIA